MNRPKPLRRPATPEEYGIRLNNGGEVVKKLKDAAALAAAENMGDVNIATLDDCAIPGKVWRPKEAFDGCLDDVF